MTAATAWAEGAIVLEDFRVVRRLGTGTFGAVSLVENTRSGELYAAKQLVVPDPDAQGRFLLEAQRWIGIPTYAYIVSCYFVRAVDDTVVLFSEYVSGGSLADWIRSRRIYEVEAPLEQVLRVAAQSALGLHEAHRSGLLHLDMKPGNILLADDGGARIADFGLAAGKETTPEARVMSERVLEYLTDIPEMDDSVKEHLRGVFRQTLLAPSGDDLVVTAREGLTPAYSPPEQLYGGALTPATDVYSWAASMLELFAGGVTWPAGPDAAIALEDLRRRDGGAIPLPPSVAELLGECLRGNPAERPKSLDDLAARLGRICQDETGRSLELAHTPGDSSDRDDHPQVLAGAISWAEPRGWLRLAYEVAGLDPMDSVAFWPKGGGTLKAQVLEDLHALIEARRVLTPVAEARGTETIGALARLHADIGRVRVYLGDTAGAIHDHEVAVDLLESHAADQLLLERAAILNALAILLRGEGRIDDSLVASGSAIELSRAAEGGDAAHSVLGTALLADANTRRGSEEALRLFDEACEEFEAAGDTAGLVRTLASKASALDYVDETQAAATWQRVDEMLDSLVESGRRDLRSLRATTLLNRALGARDVGDQLRFALAAIEIYKPLVEDDGEYRFADELGSAFFHAGLAYEHEGRPQDALEAYGSARRHLERAVGQDGRSQLADELAKAYDHESTLLAAFGRVDEAVESARRAVDRWARLARLDGEGIWTTQLATAEMKLARALGEQGSLAEAMPTIGDAIRLLEDSQDEGARRALAGAFSERGSLLRLDGDPQGAVASHQLALDVLRDLPHVEDRRDEARVLENVSNIYADTRNYELGIETIERSIEIRRGLGNDERSLADLAGALHNRFNKLIRVGDYGAALDAVAEVTALYDDLVGRGRMDLVPERARLLAAEGLALQRGGDPEAAIAAFEKARAAYAGGISPEPEQLGAVHGQLDEYLVTLAELVAAREADLSSWVERAERAIALGEELARQSDADHACAVLEEAAGWLSYLGTRYESDELWELCTSTYIKNGFAAFQAQRSRAAYVSFRVAIEWSRIRLQAWVDAERLQDLARAHLGLVVTLAVEGGDEAANQAAATMDEELRAIDPAQADLWREKLRETLEALGRLDG